MYIYIYQWYSFTNKSRCLETWPKLIVHNISFHPPLRPKPRCECLWLGGMAWVSPVPRIPGSGSQVRWEKNLQVSGYSYKGIMKFCIYSSKKNLYPYISPWSKTCAGWFGDCFSSETEIISPCRTLVLVQSLRLTKVAVRDGRAVHAQINIIKRIFWACFSFKRKPWDFICWKQSLEKKCSNCRLHIIYHFHFQQKSWQIFKTQNNCIWSKK